MQKVLVDFQDGKGPSRIDGLSMSPGRAVPGVKIVAQASDFSFTRPSDAYSVTLNRYAVEATAFANLVIQIIGTPNGKPGKDAKADTKYLNCEAAMISSFAMRGQTDYIGVNCNKITVENTANPPSGSIIPGIDTPDWMGDHPWGS